MSPESLLATNRWPKSLRTLGTRLRRNRRQIISVPNDHPPLRDPVVAPCHDSPRSPRLPETDQPASTEAEVPTKFTADAHRSPITTRSGRQVKKPQRLIESCYRGDVVMLLTRDPTGFWVPDCFLGPPRRLFSWPCLSSVREHVLDSFHFVSFLGILKVKV